MVSRILKPGCQCDYMPVLEGPQGIGKSTACRILGGPWFSENLPPLHLNGGREAAAHVMGKWIIEVPEMHAMSADKHDSALLKSFLTKTHERFRAVWARKEEETPRQCFFIGTTNEETYINDPSGARRYWPIRIYRVDLNWLTMHRDPLFAEAVQRWRDKETGFPSREDEAKYFIKEQEKRQMFDELHNLMDAHLNSSPPVNETTGAAVWRAITGRSEAVPSQWDGKRMGPIFKKLGFKPAPYHGRGGRKWIREP
jgi:predicted P-loop ATPase